MPLNFTPSGLGQLLLPKISGNSPHDEAVHFEWLFNKCAPTLKFDMQMSYGATGPIKGPFWPSSMEKFLTVSLIMFDLTGGVLMGWDSPGPFQTEPAGPGL